MSEVFDTTVVGAGPSGLFAAFYAGLRGMRTKIIEALPQAGGQLAVLYPEKYIYDVPGFPKVLAKDLVTQLVAQTETFAPEIVYGRRAETLDRTSVDGEEVWRVGDGTDHHLTRTVIITAGIGAFAPNRMDSPGVVEFEGRGVEYFVQDKRPLRGKRLLIVGGGDTAVDWALNLKDWASHVTLIHRRDEFRAHESSVTELRTSNVEVLTPYELAEVRGDGVVAGATIEHGKTHETRDLEVDTVLINIGFKAALGPIGGWGLALSGSRGIVVNALMETNLSGVFAAGDVASVQGEESLNLLVTGFAQAAIAANAAKQRITGERLFPGHSSELRL
jgi:thioredoxin reductase